ncbi:MAG: hypothetical protein LBI60_04715 [Bacteroidales bacterium]|jgi:hypothetical protein|nr:hypothetical protein [Bacteroidales bacterium]
MKATFEKQIEIKFWYEHSEELENLNADDRNYLEEEALSRIFEMVKEGYTSGEICACIEDTEFNGWWEYRIINK